MITLQMILFSFTEVTMKLTKKYLYPLIILIVFECVAVTLWLTKDNLFYLFNFSYIGLSISLGMVLFIREYKYARRIVQLSGIISSPGYSKPRPSTMRSPRSSARCSLGGAGADMPAGQPWCSTSCPTQSPKSRAKRSAGSGISCSRHR